MTEKNVTLDVRDDIRTGREPFSTIIDAVARLGPNENLLLIVPFKPAPLIGLLEKKGFVHSAKQIENDEWEVLFSRASTKALENYPPIQDNSTNAESKLTLYVEVDARGFEPPQPMIKILEMLATLPESTELRALTDRRPIHLYTLLEARGFNGQTEEQKDGSFLTFIRRS